MARMAASLALELAVRQNARSAVKAASPWITPQRHCLRRCLAALFPPSMTLAYHAPCNPAGAGTRGFRPFLPGCGVHARCELESAGLLASIVKYIADVRQLDSSRCSGRDAPTSPEAMHLDVTVAIPRNSAL